MQLYSYIAKDSRYYAVAGVKLKIGSRFLKGALP